MIAVSCQNRCAVRIADFAEGVLARPRSFSQNVPLAPNISFPRPAVFSVPSAILTTFYKLDLTKC